MRSLNQLLTAALLAVAACAAATPALPTSHTPRLVVGNLTILPVQALQCVQAQAT